MKKNMIVLFVAAVFMMLTFAPNVHAYSYTGITGDAAGNGTLAHPGDQAPTGGAGDWTFNLSSDTNFVWVGLSFDHVGPLNDGIFNYSVNSLAIDGITVLEAAYSGVTKKVVDPIALDNDDWLMLWTFDTAVSSIHIVLDTTNMGLTTSLGGTIGPGSNKVELDGISVPEPATLFLLGSGITVLGIVRRKFKV